MYKWKKNGCRAILFQKNSGKSHEICFYLFQSITKQEGSKKAQELCDKSPQKLRFPTHTVNYSTVAENSDSTFRQFKHK